MRYGGLVRVAVHSAAPARAAGAVAVAVAAAPKRRRTMHIGADPEPMEEEEDEEAEAEENAEMAEAADGADEEDDELMNAPDEYEEDVVGLPEEALVPQQCSSRWATMKIGKSLKGSKADRSDVEADRQRAYEQENTYKDASAQANESNAALSTAKPKVGQPDPVQFSSRARGMSAAERRRLWDRRRRRQRWSKGRRPGGEILGKGGGGVAEAQDGRRERRAQGARRSSDRVARATRRARRVGDAAAPSGPCSSTTGV